jgi:hypothetical protein
MFTLSPLQRNRLLSQIKKARMNKRHISMARFSNKAIKPIPVLTGSNKKKSVRRILDLPVKNRIQQLLEYGD